MKIYKGARPAVAVCEVYGEPADHIIVPRPESGAPYGTVLLYCEKHSPYHD